MREPTNAEKAIYGADVKIGADGKPIEKGKGSALQQTAQHLAALKKAEGDADK